jgi:hypothetical protein
MAAVRSFTCKKCNEPKTEVVHESGFCVECRTKVAARSRRVHLADLKGLSFEERLSRIEEQLYDTNAGPRLKSIEVQHQTFG